MKIEVLFQKISEFAVKTNTELYPVGGFVRDQILKRDSKDIDFVVIGDGIETAKNLNRYLSGHSFAFFKRFETARFSVDGYDLEFVSARKESYESKSRKPRVMKTDLLTDLSRRDFTINAIAMSISEDKFMDFIDPFSGIDDIRKKRIRTPQSPDISFSDDPLRILRAIRFSARFLFTIEQTTFESLKKHISRLEIVSKERIRDEFLQILESKNFIKALNTIKSVALNTSFIFPFENVDDFAVLDDSDLSELNYVDKLILFAIILELDTNSITHYLKYYKFSNFDIKHIVNGVLNSNLGMKILSLEKIEESMYNHFLFNASNDYKHFIALYAKLLSSKKTIPRMNRISKLAKIDKEQHYSNLKLALNGDEIAILSKLERQDLGYLIKDIKLEVLNIKIENSKNSISKYIKTRFKSSSAINQ
jgi:tRNA nucleotidyltransferase/poly(A) polymerase